MIGVRNSALRFVNIDFVSTIQVPHPYKPITEAYLHFVLGALTRNTAYMARRCGPQMMRMYFRVKVTLAASS